MKVMIIVFVFLLMVGLVCAANDWGDINVGDFEGGASVANASGDDVSDGSGSEGGDSVYDSGENVYVGSDGKYTRDFYYAVGLGIVGVLIIVVLVYLFFKRPKNKWRKR